MYPQNVLWFFIKSPCTGGQGKKILTFNIMFVITLSGNLSEQTFSQTLLDTRFHMEMYYILHNEWVIIFLSHWSNWIVVFSC